MGNFTSCLQSSSVLSQSTIFKHLFNEAIYKELLTNESTIYFSGVKWRSRYICVLQLELVRKIICLVRNGWSSLSRRWKHSPWVSFWLVLGQFSQSGTIEDKSVLNHWLPSQFHVGYATDTDNKLKLKFDLLTMFCRK